MTALKSVRRLNRSSSVVCLKTTASPGQRQGGKGCCGASPQRAAAEYAVLLPQRGLLCHAPCDGIKQQRARASLPRC